MKNRNLRSVPKKPNKLGTGLVIAAGVAAVATLLYKNYKRTKREVAKQEEKLQEAAEIVGFEKITPKNGQALLESFYEQMMLSAKWKKEWLNLNLAEDIYRKRLHIYETQLGDIRYINIAFEIPRTCYEKGPEVLRAREYMDIIREFMISKVYPIILSDNNVQPTQIHCRTIGQFIMDTAIVTEDPEDLSWGQLRISYPPAYVQSATGKNNLSAGTAALTYKYHTGQLLASDIRNIEKNVSNQRGMGEKSDIIDAIAYLKYSFPIGSGIYIDADALSKLAVIILKIMEDLKINSEDEKFESIIVYENPWMIDDNGDAESFTAFNTVRVYAPGENTSPEDSKNNKPFVDIEAFYLQSKES